MPLRNKQQGKRCYFPDEEPEREYVSYGSVPNTCKSCGHEGHKSEVCPERSIFEHDVN